MILLLLLFLSACTSQTESVSEFKGDKMFMPYQVTIGKKLSPAEKQDLQALIDESFQQINRTLNNWNDESEITLVNQSDSQISISKHLQKVLALTDEIYFLTDGRFDPTVRLSFFRDSFTEGHFPKENTPPFGWENIHIQDGILSKSGTEIDLCGIAKGYAVDLIAENLLEMGYKNFLVSWSGEIRAHGNHPEKRAWTIQILGKKDPIPLIDQSIATSGDYVFNWEIEKNLYHHIINPKTGKPIKIDKDSPTSVSCIAPTCAEADALATALLSCETMEKASELAKRIENAHPNISFFLLKK